jgi:aminoglycoside phosphotransferase (APT) family kinase protein
MAVADDPMEDSAAAAVAKWLVSQGVAVDPPLAATQIMSGQSNLTYVMSDSTGQRIIVRRPPTGQVLSTAHSMEREWRFLTALHGTEVPVPRPFALCGDDAVLGAPFYVMEYVDGIVMHTADNAQALPVTARAGITTGVASRLRRLHGVDVGARGLADIGRGEDYVARQLRRWHGQWEKIRSLADLDIPAIDEGHRALLSNIPQQERVGIVHGDFRLGNVIAGPDGAIRAILDWELATLGDPRADLGWLLLSWEEPGKPKVTNPTGIAPSTLPGFGTRSDVIAAYLAEGGPGDAADIDYFIGFAAWRWACISAGVYSRYRANVMGGRTSDQHAILQAVIDHAEYALAQVASRGTN